MGLGSSPPPPPPARFRFGLATVLVIMLVVAVIATGAGYLVRAARLDAHKSDAAFSVQLDFLLFTLASPVLVMILLSLGRRLVLWLNRPRS